MHGNCAQILGRSGRRPLRGDECRLHASVIVLLWSFEVMLLPPVQVTVDSNGDPVDVDFYRSFWGLQSTFQAPYQAMVPAAWSSAVKTIQMALKRFKQEGVAVAGGGLPAAGVHALCHGSKNVPSWITCLWLHRRYCRATELMCHCPSALTLSGPLVTSHQLLVTHSNQLELEEQQRAGQWQPVTSSDLDASGYLTSGHTASCMRQICLGLDALRKRPCSLLQVPTGHQPL